MFGVLPQMILINKPLQGMVFPPPNKGSLNILSLELFFVLSLVLALWSPFRAKRIDW